MLAQGPLHCLWGCTLLIRGRHGGLSHVASRDTGSVCFRHPVALHARRLRCQHHEEPKKLITRAFEMPTDGELSVYSAVATSAALKAGALIKEAFDKPKNVEFKGVAHACKLAYASGSQVGSHVVVLLQARWTW